jgi:hypothetical protein
VAGVLEGHERRTKLLTTRVEGEQRLNAFRLYVRTGQETRGEQAFRPDHSPRKSPAAMMLTDSRRLIAEAFETFKAFDDLTVASSGGELPTAPASLWQILQHLLA